MCCSPVQFECGLTMFVHQFGMCDKGHMSRRHHNETHLRVCRRTVTRVLTTCRVKWFVPNKVPIVLLCFIIPYIHYYLLGQVVSLTEFPECYSVPILVTLNINVQGLLSLLASLGDEAKGGECSDPGSQARPICIY